MSSGTGHNTVAWACVRQLHQPERGPMAQLEIWVTRVLLNAQWHQTKQKSVELSRSKQPQRGLQTDLGPWTAWLIRNGRAFSVIFLLLWCFIHSIFSFFLLFQKLSFQSNGSSVIFYELWRQRDFSVLCFLHLLSFFFNLFPSLNYNSSFTYVLDHFK